VRKDWVKVMAASRNEGWFSALRRNLAGE